MYEVNVRLADLHFEDRFEKQDGIDFYFTTDKKYLPKKYNNVEFATILVECSKDMKIENVAISPTRLTEDDCLEDFDWTDVIVNENVVISAIEKFRK